MTDDSFLRSMTFADPVEAGYSTPEPDRSRRGCVACREAKAVPALSMAFQPIIDLQEHRIDAYEALVRGVNGEGAAEMLKWATADNLYAFDQACRVKAIELAARLGLDRNLNINFLPTRSMSRAPASGRRWTRLPAPVSTHAV